MNSYLIKNNNNILGIYNDLDLGLDFIYSLVNCNLIQKTSNIIIYEYKINSSIILQEYKIDLNHIISTQMIINYNHNKQINKKINIEYETDSSILSSDMEETNTEEETEETK
jgi:hypothetical protein